MLFYCVLGMCLLLSFGDSVDVNLAGKQHLRQEAAIAEKEPQSPFAYQIPELPSRMTAEFKRVEHQSQPRLDDEGHRSIRGRWVYDYNIRTSLVELVDDLQGPAQAKMNPASTAAANVWVSQPSSVVEPPRSVAAPLLKTSMLFDYSQDPPTYYRWRSKGVRGLRREKIGFHTVFGDSIRTGEQSEIWKTAYAPLSCQRFTLVSPYTRMFAPASFQKLGQATVRIVAIRQNASRNQFFPFFSFLSFSFYM